MNQSIRLSVVMIRYALQADVLVGRADGAIVRVVVLEKVGQRRSSFY
jgi:hypothetical protein